MADPHLDRGLAHRLRPIAAHRHVVAVDREEQLRVVVEHPADEQGQRRLGRLVLVAGVLAVLDLGRDGLGLGLACRQLEAQLGGLDQDVGPAGHVAHEHAAVVAHRLRRDVLVAAGHPFDGVHVDATLVREGRLSDPWLARVVAHVGDAVHELRQLLELGQRLGRHPAQAHLELHDGDHAGEVAVARALTVAVDHALDVGRAGLEGGDAVGHAQPAVVVGVDADGRAELALGEGGDPGDLRRQASAVGVAQADDIGPGLLGGLPGGQRVVGLVLEAVEAVLGVVHHGLPVVLEEADRVADHAEVLVGLGAEHLGDMEQPRLAHDGDHRGLGIEQHADLLIVLDRHALAAGEAEAGDAGVLPLAACGLLEELEVLRIGAWPAALDGVDPELIEPLSDPQLVGEREIDALALGTIPERGVVDFDLLWLHVGVSVVVS